MKPEKISTVQFYSKSKFVKPKQLELIRSVSKKMCGESEMITGEDIFTANYVSAVRTKGCTLYSDSFLRKKGNEPASGCLGETNIKFDENISVAVNNETGEVTKIKKHWYTPISRLLKKMEGYLNTLNSNFGNEDVVTKRMAKVHGFTQTGFEKVMSGELNIDGALNV